VFTGYTILEVVLIELRIGFIVAVPMTTVLRLPLSVRRQGYEVFVIP